MMSGNNTQRSVVAELEKICGQMVAERKGMKARWEEICKLLERAKLQEAEASAGPVADASVSGVRAVGEGLPASQASGVAGSGLSEGGGAEGDAVGLPGTGSPVQMPRGRQLSEDGAKNLRSLSFGSTESSDWSALPDTVEETEVTSSESSGKSVVGAPEVREQMSSGGFVEGGVGVGAGADGFMATCVRTAGVEQLKLFFRSAGVRVSSRFKVELALVTYAAGAMPDGFERGPEKLEVLSLCGSAAMRAAVGRYVYLAGGDVRQADGLVSRGLSGQSLKAIGVRSGLSKCLTVPAGVGLESRAGSVFVQAVAGFLYLRCAPGSLEKFMTALQLL